MSTDYLRRNSLIRQYLHRFDERQWPEVVKLTVIFGIHSMKLNEREMQLLTIEKLSHLCAQASAAVSIHETLPTLEQNLEQLQSKISSLKDQLDHRPAIRPEPAVQSSLASIEDDGPHLAQVLSKVKQLNGTLRETRSQYSRQTVRGLQDPSGSVRQALSASDSRFSRPSKATIPKRKSRPPPRLAYSVCHNNKPGNQVDNDIVSSRYLDVPASGRDLRRCSAAVDDPGEDVIPVKEHSAPNDCTRSGSGRKPRSKSAKSKTPSYLQNVRSRIKERVQQDRMAASEHRRMLRKSIQQAISDDYPPRLESESSSLTGGRQEGTSVLKISEAFLKNPLMKPFVGPSKDHDEMGLFRQPTRSGGHHPAGSSSDLRSAPESVDELASALRGWVNSADDDIVPGTHSSRPPPDDVLASLRRLNGQAVACSLANRQDDDDCDFESPFQGTAPPEWDFSNTVFD